MIRAHLGVIGLTLSSYLAGFVFLLEGKAERLPGAMMLGAALCFIVWLFITLFVNDRRGRAGR